MRAVIQRVLSSYVEVEDKTVGQIGLGVNILLGVHQSDTDFEAKWLAEKIARLRIFDDEKGRINKTLQEVKASALVISQFTLYGDCGKGCRPSFTQAAEAKKAKSLYQEFISHLKSLGVLVETGIFQAQMKVHILNDGPVTLIIDTPQKEENTKLKEVVENPLGLRTKEWLRFQKEAEQLKRNLILRKEQGKKNG